MSATILVFANVSRSDAYVSVEDANGQEQFVTKVGAGTIARQAASAGQNWVVVLNDNYKFTADDKNHVYLIGSSGVYQVASPVAIAPDSGNAVSDFDYQGFGGGGWP